jgi:hypothetical protein
MNLNFDFPLPSKEEFKAAKMLAEIGSEWIDGREAWILNNFSEGDFE